MRTISTYHKDGSLRSVEVVVDDPENGLTYLATEVFTRLWGKNEEQGWLLFTLDGKLAMVTAAHNYHQSAECWQLALDAISAEVGGDREFLGEYHDAHDWGDGVGKLAYLFPEKGSPVLTYRCSAKGVETVKGSGKMKKYEIHPDYNDVMIVAMRGGCATH